MRASIFIAVALCCFGCNRSAPNSDQDRVNYGPPLPEPPAPGTAIYNDKTFKAGWSIALWNEAKSELIVGFLEAKPPAEKLEKIIENKDLFMGGSLGAPLVQFEVTFAETDGVIDVASPTQWTVLFANDANQFASPWTYGYPAEGALVEISGDPRSGGRVTGRFTGTNVIPYPEKPETSGWNLVFDLEVQ